MAVALANSLEMVLNYLKLTFRLLWRNILTNLINLFGLSLGLMAFLVLWSYTQAELHADQFHPDHRSIMRMGMVYRWTDDAVQWHESTYGNLHPGLIVKMKEENPDIQDVTRIFLQPIFHPDFIPDHGRDIFFSYTPAQGDRVAFLEHNVVYADPNLTDFFSIDFIEGNAAQALFNATSVILSQSTAIKYFGKQSALGKTISLNDKIALVVTGVFRDLSPNTHLKFDIALSTERIRDHIHDLHDNDYGPRCYLRLKKGVDRDAFTTTINRQFHDDIKKVGFADWPFGTNRVFVQPVDEMSFTSYFWDFYKVKSRYLLHILSVAAILALAMAWVNYVNLAVSTGAKRMKEMAIRKTVGARPADYAIQFVIESLIITMLSLLMALTLIQLLRKFISLYLNFYVPEHFTTGTIVIIALVIVSGVMITGLYSAFVSWRNSSIRLLGKFRLRKVEKGLSGTLMIGQFIIAVVLSVWSFVSWLQMEYLLHHDIGIRYDAVLAVDLPVNRDQSFDVRLESFITEIDKTSGIQQAALSHSVPGDGRQGVVQIKKDFVSPGIEADSDGGVDEQFIPFYNIQLVNGRNFIDRERDKNKVLISRKAAERLGFSGPEEATGSMLYVNNSDYDSAEIIGVFEDYKINPLRNEHSAYYGDDHGLCLLYKDNKMPEVTPAKISVRLSADSVQMVVAAIARLYNEFFPKEVFHWYVVEDLIARQYDQDAIVRNQVSFFSLLTIVIAVLGLIGLVSAAMTERTKEMGIRKVLGSTLSQLFGVMLKNTFIQLLIATAIGIPLSILLLQEYFNMYAVIVPLAWWHVCVPVLLLFVILLVTAFAVIIRSVLINPIEFLRYE